MPKTKELDDRINIYDRISMREYLDAKNPNESFSDFKKAHPVRRDSTGGLLPPSSPNAAYAPDLWNNLCTLFDRDDLKVDVNAADTTPAKDADGHKVVINKVEPIDLDDDKYDEGFELEFTFEDYTGSAKVFLKNGAFAVLKVDADNCPQAACGELFDIAMNNMDLIRNKL